MTYRSCGQTLQLLHQDEPGRALSQFPLHSAINGRLPCFLGYRRIPANGETA